MWETCIIFWWSLLPVSVHGLAPGTRAARLWVLGGFFAFLIEQGSLPKHPICRHRHEVTVPQYLPRPMADEDLVAFFRVIDVLRDRLSFRCFSRLLCHLRLNRTKRRSALPSVRP